MAGGEPATPPPWRPRLRWGTRLPGLLPPQPPTTQPQLPFTLVAPFLRWALSLSIAVGFALGSALAIDQAAGGVESRGWLALVNVHAEVQLTGFVALFILAVAVHFVPRLRGSGLYWPALARPGLGLVAGGSTLGALAGACAALWPGIALFAGVAAAAAWLTSTGCTLVLILLIATLRHGPPMSWRGGLVSILLPLGFGCFSLWGLLSLRSVLLLAGLAGISFPSWGEPLLQQGLVFAAELPITLAIAARLFPIYFGVEVVRLEVLFAIGALVEIGSWLRLAALASNHRVLLPGADLLLGSGCLLFCVASGLPVGIRRQIRRADPPALVIVARWPNLLMRSASVWLALAGLVLLWNSGARLLSGAPVFGTDAITHTVTVGYLTLLILGAGARLLPGFARRRPRADRRILVALLAGNAAAICRVVPAQAALAGVSSPVLTVAYGLSGLWAILAVGAFTVSIWPALAGAG
ncbi:MAG: hypothetical protein M1118_12370 [Chloroflexi bacterium]|nr:hypothetical protein [Chloroflexota bacterium]